MMTTCTFQVEALPLQTIPGIVRYIAPGGIFDQTAGATFFVFKVVGRTAGTITAELEGSGDGVTFYALPAAFSVLLDASGTRYIQPGRGIPKFLRVKLTPAGGFDGQLQVVIRSSGPMSTPLVTTLQG